MVTYEHRLLIKKVRHIPEAFSVFKLSPTLSEQDGITAVGEAVGIPV